MMTRWPPQRLWRYLLGLQLLAIVAICVQLVLRPYGGHYGIFTAAGRYLLEGRNPYGVDFGYGGLWFYSPTCGFFFGLLSYLPYQLGIVLFTLGSYALMLEGFRRYFLRIVPEPLRTNAYLSLFLLLSLGELLGAFQSVKLECAMLGLLLIAADLLPRRPALAAGICALLINSKWFPVAPVGLLAVAELVKRRTTFAFLVPVFLAIFFALPILPYGWAFTRELYATQHSTLNAFVSLVYLDFQSVFGSLHRNFGVTFSQGQVSAVLGVVGLALAGVVAVSKLCREETTAVALALGMLFVVTFNLLSQSNAYMLALPALAYALGITLLERGATRILAALSVGTYWVLVSLLSSDLVPRAVRDRAGAMLLKPVGSFLLLVFIVGVVVTKRRRYARTAGLTASTNVAHASS